MLITGPTGAGKTALAVHAGYLARERFPDGQVFVPMTSREGVARPRADLLAELMAAVGLNPAGVTRETAALALWRSWTADKAVLIVLDGAVDEACVADILPGDGRSRTIVTSTRRMAGLDAVERIRLRGLARADAVDWLTHMLVRAVPLETGVAPHAVDTAVAAGYADRVVDRVGTLPLLLRAVAIAGVDAIDQGRPAPGADWGDQVAQRLGSVSVSGTAVREHYRRLEASLSAEGRSALRALGRLPGTRFGLGQVLTALGGGSAERSVSEVMAELLDAHVLAVAEDGTDDVVAHGDGFTMPGLTHSYASQLARRRPAPLFLGPLPE
jgi:hypothetical protein